MNAAMVLGLLDPMGGKVMRSDYKIGPNDYVIKPGDTPESVSQQLQTGMQELEGMQTGDVVPYDAPDFEVGDVPHKLDPKRINKELLRSIIPEGSDVDDDAMMKQLEGYDDFDYDQLEEGAVFELLHQAGKVGKGMDYETQMKALQDIGTKYPEPAKRVMKLFADAIPLGGNTDGN